MEEQKFSISEAFNKSKEYIDTQIELLKLQALSRASRIVGSLVVDASKLLLTLLIVFFWSLALGFYLGELLGSNALGFLATGGIFLVLFLLIRAFEPSLEKKFMDLSIRKIASKWEDPEDEDLNEDPAEETQQQETQEQANTAPEESSEQRESQQSNERA